MPFTSTHLATGHLMVPADWNPVVDGLAQLDVGAGWTSTAAGLNSWAGTVFSITAGGYAFLAGTVTGGAAGASAVTLPAAFRPSTARSFMVWANSGTTVNKVAVFADGSILPANTATTWLTGIRYPVTI